MATARSACVNRSSPAIREQGGRASEPAVARDSVAGDRLGGLVSASPEYKATSLWGGSRLPYVQRPAVDPLKRWYPKPGVDFPIFQSLEGPQGVPVINIHLWVDRKLHRRSTTFVQSFRSCQRVRRH